MVGSAVQGAKQRQKLRQKVLVALTQEVVAAKTSVCTDLRIYFLKDKSAFFISATNTLTAFGPMP